MHFFSEWPLVELSGVKNPTQIQCILVSLVLSHVLGEDVLGGSPRQLRQLKKDSTGKSYPFFGGLELQGKSKTVQGKIICFI
jgi:hypothetical protein